MFTCSICGETISKRKSYYIGKDGAGNAIRACKTHEEAQTYQQDVAVKEQERLRQEVRNNYRTFAPLEVGPNTEEIRDSCWCCRATGRPVHEFYDKLIDNIRKTKEAGGKTDLSDPNDNAVGDMLDEMGDIPPMWLADLSNLEDWQIRQVVQWKLAFEVAASQKVTILCAACMDKYELKPTMRGKEAANMIKILDIIIMAVLRQRRGLALPYAALRGE